MKVIFLDFDGVITSFYEDQNVDDLCIALLKYIVDKTSAKIVVTASAKECVQLGYTSFENSNLRNVYLKRLEQYHLVPYDYTKYIGSNRDLEIKDYLDHHPEITEYLILDDEPDSEVFNGHLVLVDAGCGLSLKNIKNSLSILNGNLKFYDPNEIEFNSEKREIENNQKFDKLMERKKKYERNLKR